MTFDSRAAAGTISGPTTPAAVHPFTPDCYEPGYRPSCRVCGADRAAHIPAPRQPAGDNADREWAATYLSKVQGRPVTGGDLLDELVARLRGARC